MIPRPLTVQTLRRAEDLPTHEHAKCLCGQYYTFGTDRLGRTVEICHHCRTRQLITGRSAPAEPRRRPEESSTRRASKQRHHAKATAARAAELLEVIPRREADALGAADMGPALGMAMQSVYPALSLLTRNGQVKRKKVKAPGQRLSAYRYWKAA